MTNHKGKIRVHVAEGTNFPPTWRLTRDGLVAAFRKHPGLKGRVSLTFGDNTNAGDSDLAVAEVLFAGEFRPPDLATRALKLKWMHSSSAGVDKFVAIVPKGVMLTSNSGAHPDKGGEFNMTCLLMLNHRIPHFVTRQKQAQWDPIFSSMIDGKTVVIIGTGAIGTATAKQAKRYRMRVLGVNRSGQPKRFFDRVHAAKDLRKVLPEADFVVVCTPLTNDTRGMLGRKELDLLPRSAGLINVGRGAVIDNDALLEKLHNGELSGAVLDVFPTEPSPSTSSFWSTPNLIMTPHCGVDDAEAWPARTYDLFLTNLRRYLDGKNLKNVVDTARGY